MSSKGGRQKSFVIFGSCARCFTNVKPLHVPGTLKETKRKLLHASDATHHPPVVLVEGADRAWVDERAVEVHGVSGDTSAPRSGPIEPGGITGVDRRTIHVPGIDEVIRIRSEGIGDWSSFISRIIWVC